MKESLLHTEAIKLPAVKAAHLLLEKVISSCHGEHFEFTQHLLAGGEADTAHRATDCRSEISQHFPLIWMLSWKLCGRILLPHPWLVSEDLLDSKSVSEVAIAEKYPTSSILGVSWQRFKAQRLCFRMYYPLLTGWT